MKRLRIILIMIIIAVISSVVTFLLKTGADNETLTCQIFRRLDTKETLSIMANSLEEEIIYNINSFEFVDEELLTKIEKSSEVVDWQKFKKKNIDGACECSLYEYCENCVAENILDNDYNVPFLYEEVGVTRIKSSEYDINLSRVYADDIFSFSRDCSLDLYYSFYNEKGQNIGTFKATELITNYVNAHVMYFKPAEKFQGYFFGISDFSIMNQNRHRELMAIKERVKNIKLPGSWTRIVENDKARKRKEVRHARELLAR